MKTKSMHEIFQSTPTYRYTWSSEFDFVSDLRTELQITSKNLLYLSLLSGSRFWLRSGDKGWVMLFWKIILLHAIIVTSGGWGRWEAGGQAWGGGVARGELRRTVKSCHAWLWSWLTVGPLCFTDLLTACLVVFQEETGLSADCIRK